MFGSIVIFVCVFGYGLLQAIPERQIGCPIPNFDPEFCSRAFRAFECQSDSDCQKDDGKEYKCCVSSCNGRTCVEQNIYKQGACPKKLNKMCAMKAQVYCGLDSDCPGEQLCCETACHGADCRAPARPPEVKFGCQLPQRGNFFCPGVIPIYLCNTDNDCQGTKVCCKTACRSLLCVEPEQKPGTCPHLPLTKSLCLLTDPILCGIDKECEAQNKCCKTRCGGSVCKVTAPALPECTDDPTWLVTLEYNNKKCKHCTCRKLSKRKHKAIRKLACKKNNAGARKCCATCRKYNY